MAAGWGVLHIKFLSLCHVYRRRRRRASPLPWQSAPNWLLFNRDATSVSCGLLHILCISCPQIAVHPLLPLSALLLLAAKAPESYSLCHRIASNNFASVSACLACLVVCFSRPSKRFAHLPVYMCCAVVYCSQWAWQEGETVIKRASAVACCHIKLPIYFLGLQQQRCNLATFCATDKFLYISYDSP